MPDLPDAAPPPAALDRSMTDIAGRSGRLVRDWLAHQAHEPQPVDPALVGNAFLDMTAQLMAAPSRVMQAGIGFWQDYMTLWQSSTRRMWGLDAPPVIGPVPEDRRFDGDVWSSSEVFGFIKQSYLLSARYIRDVTGCDATGRDITGRDAVGRDGAGFPSALDLRMAQRVDFFARQFIDAMSPSNFLLTNPEALRRTAETGGENLLRGLSSLLQDLERGRGRLLAGGTPRLGVDAAATPGKVVLQNRLMQVIQYAPMTERVLRRPLLIVPPWTSKYYALDLQPRSSMVRWAAAQGHTVFMISWVNPAPDQPDLSFEDYLRDGVLAAVKAACDAAGVQEVNAAGFCVGGTLLAAAAAWMAAAGDGRVRSVSLLASLLDFSEAGELGVFMDEEGLRALEGHADSPAGPPDSLLRANDLLWSFVVNTYLLGAEPFPLELLHWNADAVRMPAALHGFYLRRIYQENLLHVPGGLHAAGLALDLGAVQAPSYALATREDHIAPWASVYRSAALLGGPRRFVLAGSGHVAGVVNPPAVGKYSHWVGGDLPEAPEDWLAGATEMAGSWWPDWHRWLAAQDGATVPARVPGIGALPALEDAPGSHVRVRS